MKMKYSVLVGLLAAGILAAPALAGSTGAGQKKATETYIDKTVDNSRSYVTGVVYLTGVKGTADGYNPGKTVYSNSAKVSYSNPKTAAVQNMIDAAYNTAYYLANKCKTEGARGEFHMSTSSSSKTWDNRQYSTVESGSGVLVGDADYMNSAYGVNQEYSVTHIATGDYGRNTYYRVEASGWVSPIILDLDGDGKIEASEGKYMPHSADVSKSKHAVMFDFYGNGFPVAMEWVGANDGLLCRPHKDGSIDGTCLFGVANGHDNGYEELASLDIDRDGNLAGAELEGLKVWTDKNSNGIAEDGEVIALESLGITSIGVDHNNFVGNYVRNGKSYKTFDWWPCVVNCRKVNLKNI
jgi:hypothetical protein